MTAPLETVVSELRSQQTTLQAQLDTVETERKAVKSQLKALSNAIRSLTGDKPRPNGKPAPTQAEVSEAICSILTSKGTCQEAVLADLVRDVLNAAGKSRAGLKGKLRDALKDKRFVRDAQGYRLNKPSKADEATT